MKLYLTYLVFILCAVNSYSQIYEHATTVELFVGGKKLDNPFTGGFNNSQFLNFDLNNDGIKDIVVFEKATQKFLPFILNKSNNSYLYIYAPKYETNFPVCSNWVSMKDYNRDGAEDIFTYAQLGMKVYKCVRTADSFYFTLVQDPIYSDYFGLKTNLLVNNDDYPLIDDLDGDGDLDVVNFYFLTGATLEFHLNQSYDKYKSYDSLTFKQKDECYGNFQEITCDSFSFNWNCKIQRKDYSNLRTTHVGYGAIAFYDVDGDSLNDLLISKVDCDEINYLKNIGTKTKPNFEQVLYKYHKSNLFKLQGFPTVFTIDINSDFEKDFLVSYGTINGAQTIDFEHSNYLVQNGIVVNNQFLQDETLDLGENTGPILVDVDGDSDNDLLVGYHTFKQHTNYRGGLALYTNLGSDSLPIYSFQTNNYLNLLTKQRTHIIPQAFDWDNDGNLDLIVTSTEPQKNSQTQSYVFKGKTNGYFTFSGTVDTLSLPLNQDDVPYFVYSKQFNSVKVLVGKTNGYLQLFNYANQQFNLETNKLGFIPDAYTKYTSVAEANMDNDSLADLIMTNSSGNLLWVANYESQNTNSWFIDTLKTISGNGSKTLPIRLTNKSVLASYTNSNARSTILVGSKAGGIFVFNESNSKIPETQNLEYFPNPTTDVLIVKSNKEMDFELYDLSGKLLLLGKLNKGTNLLNLEKLPAGLYFVKTLQKTLKVFKY